MKKIVAIVLSAVMICSLSGCAQTVQETQETKTEEATLESIPLDEKPADEGSEEKEYTGSIPLGGSLGDYPVEGDAYGIYKEVDPASLYDVPEGVEAHAYVAKDCDTPYIITSRWAADGNTLEDVIKALAAEYSDDYYVHYDSLPESAGAKEAYYYCSSYESENSFYYCDSLLFQDGDEFVTIDWYAATEEVALNDSGYYMWVPTGYEDIVSDTEKKYGVVFSGEYEDAYELPWIWVAKLDGTYEQVCNLWGDGDLTMTAEEYKKFVEAEEWTDELTEEFYGAFDETVVFSEECESKGIPYSITGYTQNGEKAFNEDVYIEIDGDTYEFWLGYPEGHNEYYGDVIIDSIHKK